MSDIVIVKNLVKSYKSNVVQVIFNGASFSMRERDLVALVAPSGYGKSTFIHILSGLEKFDSGEVIVCGMDIKKLTPSQRADFRRRYIGIVFQFYNLLPTLTALENVMLPMQLIKVPREEAYERAMELLTIVGLEDKWNRFPSQLSGGEQQRVAIARALANSPSLILADEPTGNLDEENADKVFQLLRKVNEEERTGILIATHDVERARRYMDTLYTIKDKKIFELR